MINKWTKLNYLISEIEGIYHELNIKVGISDSERMILYSLIDNNGKCSQCDIYKSAGISRKTVNSAISKMKNNGYLTVKKLNGRDTDIELTEKGKDFANHTISHIINIENEIADEWTENEISIYTDLTEKYLKMIKEKTKKIEKRV